MSGVLWGTIGIAAQTIYLQSEISSFVVSFYRLAFGFPFVVLACWLIVEKEALKVGRLDRLKMGIMGIMLALYQVFYFTAIEYVGVILAALITLCAAPVLVSLASAIFIKEDLTQNTLGALTLAAFGTFLIIGAPEKITSNNHLFIGVW